MLGEAKIEVVRLEFKSLKDFSALALTRYGTAAAQEIIWEERLDTLEKPMSPVTKIAGSVRDRADAAWMASGVLRLVSARIRSARSITRGAISTMVRSVAEKKDRYRSISGVLRSRTGLTRHSSRLSRDTAKRLPGCASKISVTTERTLSLNAGIAST